MKPLFSFAIIRVHSRALLFLLSASAIAEPLGDDWGTAESEEEFYKITEIAIPEPHYIEAGSFETMPDGRVAVGTRRGDIYLLDGISDKHQRVEFQKYAAGFDELLGLSYNKKDGALYATHAAEVTKLTDTDGDGRAQGHVHEFDIEALRSAKGERPLHRDAYYTLNEIPKAE